MEYICYYTIHVHVSYMKAPINVLCTIMSILAFTEHESCVTDINELKWHCGYRGRLETRIKKRVDYAGKPHTRYCIQNLENSL